MSMTPYSSEKIRIISFVSILLVVFLHAYNLERVAPLERPLFFGTPTWFAQDFISYGITRTAVPLFFLFSGFLFFLDRSGDRVFARKIGKRFYTLFVPFMFWSLAGIALYFVLQSVPQTAVFFTKEHVADYNLNDWLFRLFIIPVPYQLWFIRDLMLLVLLSPVLNYLLENGKAWLLLPMVAGWFCIGGDWVNPVEALLFFSAGGYLAIHRPDQINRRYDNKGVLWLLIWILITAGKTFLLYSAQDEVLVRVLFKLSILTGIIAIWSVYDAWPSGNQQAKAKLLAICSMTFIVYAAHEPMLTILKKLLFVIFGKRENDFLLVYVAAPILAIGLAMLLGVLLRKYCNRFYEIITGGR
jgi:surface polysaccharide O-acyltransferase-like enzyme